jgi:hypothetical protein
MAKLRRSPVPLPVLLATVVLAAVIASGCDLLGDPAVSVTVPPLPTAYGGEAIEWTVRWWDGAGIRETEIVAPENHADVMIPLAAGGTPTATLNVELPLSAAGAEAVVVTAEGRISPGIRLKPYGGWCRSPDDRIAPIRELGVAAEVLLQLAAAGIDPALINVERLAREVAEECGDDPATLDRERLVEALGTSEMRRYAIRRRDRPACEVSLPGEVPANWITDDPTDPVIEGVVAAGRCYWVVPVATGEVRYLRRHVPSGWDVLTVGRDAEGHAFWYLRTVDDPSSPEAAREVPERRRVTGRGGLP